MTLKDKIAHETRLYKIETYDLIFDLRRMGKSKKEIDEIQKKRNIEFREYIESIRREWRNYNG